jgi:hypothetical protein
MMNVTTQPSLRAKRSNLRPDEQALSPVQEIASQKTLAMTVAE